MTGSNSAWQSAFDNVLRSYLSGSVAATHVLDLLARALADGASPSDLLEVLASRERTEPLPGAVHDALLDRLRGPAGTSSPLAEMPTILLDERTETELRAARPAPLTVDLDAADTPDGDVAASHDRPVGVGDVLRRRFRLLELIGEGGLGRVFKAIDSSPPAEYAADPVVAVKVLPPGSSTPTLPTLRHPNIVRLYGTERDGDNVFVVMEYLRGVSLYKRLYAAPGTPTGLTRDAALSILAAVADALEFAHRWGVVHGDLKPGNVILTEDGGIKLIDFAVGGLDRGRLAVTPRYASPQVMARNKATPADDVYALACLAYEILTGHHPYDEASANTQPPPPRPELDSTQYAAIAHALAADHADRTASVQQFMSEFHTPERRPVWTGIAAAAALLIIVAGWFLWRQPHAPRATDATVPSAASSPAPAIARATVGQPGEDIRDCDLCPLVKILPAGRIVQGSPADAPGVSSFEQPAHDVVIDHPFAMGVNDVTVREFAEFAEVEASAQSNPGGCEIYDGQWRPQPAASWQNPGFAQGPLHPVTCVSWNDAVAYAHWLSKKTGQHYRLPSAAEWEYAARSGGPAPPPWAAGAAACRYANVADRSAVQRYPGWSAVDCDDHYVYTSPVGSFKANAFGLNDMLGNVFQWTEDCWHDSYLDAPDDGAARAGACTDHETRGGSWFSTPSYVRAAYRNHFAAGHRTSSVGFRVIREIAP